MTRSMKAVRTRYFGPTNTKGARIQATDGDTKLWLSWDHALSIDENHMIAFDTFKQYQDWAGHWRAAWFKLDCYHVET
jgi:hypothetical protein